MPITDKTPKIYLSRRNLQALPSKLDRFAAGDETACSLLKVQHVSPAYRQTMKKIMVIGVEDDEYYSAQDRPAGLMLEPDETRITAPVTGVRFSPLEEY